jgi:hypothetical protein
MGGVMRVSKWGGAQKVRRGGAPSENDLMEVL